MILLTLIVIWVYCIPTYFWNSIIKNNTYYLGIICDNLKHEV